MLEPPDSACLKALLQQVATQSAALNMPLEDGSNHTARGDANSAATKAAYARLEGNMMTVCRAAKIALRDGRRGHRKRYTRRSDEAQGLRLEHAEDAARARPLSQKL